MRKVESKQVKIKIYAGLLILAACFGAARAQSGGSYAVTPSVIASGGQNSAGGTFALDGTIGQTIAGQPAGGATFRVYGGFFAPPSFVPTAAAVSVGGRVTTATGAGIRNVAVTLTSADGVAQNTATGAGGRFIFADVTAGATYIITVAAKRYQFAQPSQIFNVSEDIEDVLFVADSNKIIPLPPILSSPIN